jgi:hypothetical protein
MDKSDVDPFLKSLGYQDPVERPEHMFLYLAKDSFSTI